ncbi:hypothetical protein AX15_005985 [Amanita polypyramis BW_CC]|nr:hypothetical protein AX15_005985 [Amanita polypyramis BW_CC]
MDASSESWLQSSVPSSSPATAIKSSTVQKKPRHRHSPAQLAALNELFEKNEHPSLEQRIALAEQLGMETKTVNAWFQNKRASSKKRSRNHPCTASRPSRPAIAPPTPPASSSLPHITEFDDYHDDEVSSLDLNQSHLVPDMGHQYHHLPYISENGDVPQVTTEAESIPRRTRARPTMEQAEELKRLYDRNPHPSAELRQALSDRLGMRYQSITNWFQNQRSISRKRTHAHEDLDLAARLQSDHVLERQYLAYPSAYSHHPLVPVPHDDVRITADHQFHEDESCGKPRRFSAPYGTPSSYSRPRRSRPEPYQLDALKELFTKTPTPSIEERSALAAEIGMDIGKVTNWFRNLRQTARKRAKKTGSSEEDDDSSSFRGNDAASSTFSRPVTPSQHSTSSLNEESMDLDDCDHELRHSDVISDEDYPEAVTPSPEPQPPVSATLKPGLPSYPGLDKLSMAQYHGVKIEDALLLLSFHQHAVH